MHSLSYRIRFALCLCLMDSNFYVFEVCKFDFVCEVGVGVLSEYVKRGIISEVSPPPPPPPSPQTSKVCMVEGNG